MRDWSVGRPCTELGVGHGWLDRQLTRLGYDPEHPGRLATGVDGLPEPAALITITQRRTLDDTATAQPLEDEHFWHHMPGRHRGTPRTGHYCPS